MYTQQGKTLASSLHTYRWNSFSCHKPPPLVNAFFPGNNQADWARNLKSEDFELLCRNGERRPISEYSNCNLGAAPPHGVVARPEQADLVRRILENQEVRLQQGTSQLILNYSK